MISLSFFTAFWNKLTHWFTLNQRLVLKRPGVLLFGLAILLLALVFPLRWLLYLLYVYLIVVLGCYFWVRTLGPQLRLARHIETTWAQVGDELEERWSLENRSALPLPWLEIDDGSTLPGYNGRRVAFCEAGKQQHWRTSAVCTRRGRYKLGPLTASFSDPFDLFGFSWREQTTRQLIVYPPLVRLPALLFPRGMRGGLAQADLLQLHATPSVGGVRDYAPGDPLSRVHWPHVARHQRLVVKEFDQERAGALWLVLDLTAAAYQHAGASERAPRPVDGPFQTSAIHTLAVEYQPPTLAELAITLTASLAAQALAQGRSVGLLCNDGQRRMVLPGSSSRHLWNILNELVESSASGQLPLETLLRQGTGTQGQGLDDAALAVITPALDGAWLPALAMQTRKPGGAMALLVAHEESQAAGCAALLGTYGVPSHVFTLGTSLPLVNPPRRPVTTRVSPLGRVVQVGR